MCYTISRIAVLPMLALMALRALAEPATLFNELPAVEYTLRVAIYSGSGSQESGIRDVEGGIKLLRGATIERMPPEDFVERDLKEFDVIVFSAGGASIQAREVGNKGRERIRKFVQDGGAYLGICAGAYLACAEFDWGLRLIAAQTISDPWQRGVGEVKMQLSPDGHKVFGKVESPFKVSYENGPVIAPLETEGMPSYRTLATFATELAENGSPPGIMIGSPAIAEASYGKGRVMIFSPHPERTSGLEKLIPLAICRLITD